MPYADPEKRRAYARAWKKANARVGHDPNKWSRKDDACRACGTTDRPHSARGLCNACYLAAHRAAFNPRDTVRQETRSRPRPPGTARPRSPKDTR